MIKFIVNRNDTMKIKISEFIVIANGYFVFRVVFGIGSVLR